MTARPLVVVVADDPIIGCLLKRLLSHSGYAVRAPCDPAARSTPWLRRPDVLVYDPFPIDEAARAVAEGVRRRFPGLPAVRFSPRYTQADEPSVPFLPMPFAPGELESAVAAALRTADTAA